MAITVIRVFRSTDDKIIDKLPFNAITMPCLNFDGLRIMEKAIVIQFTQGPEIAVCKWGDTRW